MNTFRQTEVQISVREMYESDIEKIVDYFINSNDEFLIGMGADKNKLPKRVNWISKLKAEFIKSNEEKEFYYLIWLLNNNPIGHSNINNIEFGKSAKMHLHLWKNEKRKSGLGLKLLKKTIPFYFENFELKKLICEPYHKNIAPNKVVIKTGFEFIKNYETIPGPINFKQFVNRYEMTFERYKAFKIKLR